MIKRLLREETGSTLPLVAILLGVFLLGFTALVVDAGTLYVERRTLVTAADAGALAGAKELADNLSDKSFTQAIKDNAVNIAKEEAVSNGADSRDNVSVTIEKKNVNYRNSQGTLVNEDRDIIEVIVKNTRQTIFARFLGSNNNKADVAASAVATWGYMKETSGGSILPIFTMDEIYKNTAIGAPIYLNGDKFLSAGSEVPPTVSVPGNWGLFDIKKASLDPTGVSIKDALSGDESAKDMILKATVESETGQKIGSVNDVITRMKNAVSKYPGTSQVQERQEYMSGLVPIIDYNQFQVLNPVTKDKNGVSKLPNPLILPITQFAVFEIRDYLVDDGTGAAEALDLPNYLPDGIKNTYSSDYKKNTLVGAYTGKEVKVRAEITSGDQQLDKDETAIIKYEKLIQ